MSRRQSLNTARVSLAEHRAWLARRLDDRRGGLWIALDRGRRPVGQLRVDAARDVGTVSITVAPSRRGKGWATDMLRSNPCRVRTLRALIRPENVASAVAFLKAGYCFERVARVGGSAVYELFRRGRG